jgi:hypothetical protein
MATTETLSLLPLRDCFDSIHAARAINFITASLDELKSSEQLPLLACGGLRCQRRCFVISIRFPKQTILHAFGVETFGGVDQLLLRTNRTDDDAGMFAGKPAATGGF